MPLIQGPFLYLYTTAQLTGRGFRFRDLLHFLPLVLSIASFTDFHFLNDEQKLDVFARKGEGYETRMLVNLLALCASGVVYIILSLRRLIAYRRNLHYQFSNTEKIKLDWLLYLIIWIIVIWIAILFTRDDTLIFGSASLFVLWLGYFGIKQVNIFSQPQENPEQLTALLAAHETTDIPAIAENAETVKYRKSSLTDTDVAEIHLRLREHLHREKSFINPELKLDDLARTLNVHPNHLSQVINTKEGKNFYDLINELRINEFISRMSLPENAKLTLLGLAFDCGFNSKTSFNRNFKKHTGQTPSEYVKTKIPVT